MLSRIIVKWRENVCTNGKNYTKCRSRFFSALHSSLTFNFAIVTMASGIISKSTFERQFAEFKAITVLQEMT